MAIRGVQDGTVAALVDDLEGRLTSTRAGYLDNLSAGAVALQSAVDDLETRLTAARAGYLDNLSGGAGATAAALTAAANALGGNLVSKAITYVAATASYNVFTVGGLVAVKVVGYVNTVLTNHGDTTSLGTATSAAGLLAATAGSAMQTEGQVWVDNAPSKFETYPTNWTLIGNGEDIVLTSTNNLTAGVVTFYCWYMPISSGASVAAA